MSLQEISRRVVACKRCPELRAYCARIARERKAAFRTQAYWGKPVPSFGDRHARVLLVGLAPGAHGSNRTGRPFTGDASGDFLYPALYRAGFASQPNATDRHDGLRLRDCVITAAVRCAPPGNKPTTQQLRNCFPYLVDELNALPSLAIAIGLGKIGFDAIVRALRECNYTFDEKPVFGHAREYRARTGKREVTLIASFHPSRQNTNTGVLTRPMFDAIFARAKELVGGGRAPSG